MVLAMSEGRKHVPSTVVIGPHGPMVTRGYTDVGGLRIYDDQMQVGPYGQPVISPGYISRPTRKDDRRG
jgi:hypothetical protein